MNIIKSKINSAVFLKETFKRTIWLRRISGFFIFVVLFTLFKIKHISRWFSKNFSLISFLFEFFALTELKRQFLTVPYIFKQLNFYMKLCLSSWIFFPWFSLKSYKKPTQTYDHKNLIYLMRYFISSFVRFCFIFYSYNNWNLLQGNVRVWCFVSK